MLNSQRHIKANLAQRSAGEVALQSHCSRARGEKQGRRPSYHAGHAQRHRVPALHRKRDDIRENVSVRMWLNPVSAPQIAAVLLLHSECVTLSFLSLMFTCSVPLIPSFSHYFFLLFFHAKTSINILCPFYFLMDPVQLIRLFFSLFYTLTISLRTKSSFAFNIIFKMFLLL